MPVWAFIIIFAIQKRGRLTDDPKYNLFTSKISNYENFRLTKVVLFYETAKQMARKTIIRLDTSQYRQPTQEDLDEAKNFVIRRGKTLDDIRIGASEAIRDTVARITEIATEYDINPEDFAFDSSVNEDMMARVAEEMDELEDMLVEMAQRYATESAKGDGMKALLIGLLLSLGHRNMGLQSTLHEYLWRTLRQTEGMIAAAKAANRSATQIISLVRSNIGQSVITADMQRIARYRHLYRAPFVSSGGKATYSDGTPNPSGVPVNGVQATVNTLVNAVARTLNRENTIEMTQNGAIGYWQARGSDYDCPICDEEVGFHELGDIEYDEYPHLNCCCMRIPIYRKEELENYGI